MKKLSKALIVLSGVAALSGCVIDDQGDSAYYSQNGYPSPAYQSTYYSNNYYPSHRHHYRRYERGYSSTQSAPVAGYSSNHGRRGFSSTGSSAPISAGFSSSQSAPAQAGFSSSGTPASAAPSDAGFSSSSAPSAPASAAPVNAGFSSSAVPAPAPVSAAPVSTAPASTGFSSGTDKDKDKETGTQPIVPAAPADNGGFSH